jgi:hypothetical protein
VRVSPDGKAVAVKGVERGTVGIWETETGKQVTELARPAELPREADVTWVAWSGNGTHLAVGYGARGFRLWDTTSAQVVGKGPGLPSGVAALSPDERFLAVAGDGSVIHLRELASGAEVARFRGHEEGVLGLVFSPDTRLLASSARDNTVLLWDPLDPRRRGSRTPPGGLTDRELDTLWDDLDEATPGQGYRAACTLAAAPREALALFQRALKPEPHKDKKQVTQLIGDLDNEQFSTREAAFEKLTRMGRIIKPELEEASRNPPSAEVRKRLAGLLEKIDTSPDPGALRKIRAVQLLERCASDEAKRLLKQLAKGEPAAPLTQEAKAALSRLGTD